MKKFLVVVDMQNDFISGSLGSDRAREVVEPVRERIENALADGYEVIFTKDTHDENYLNTDEGRRLPIKHCIRNTDGCNIHKNLQKYTKNVIEKGQFSSMKLVEQLSAKNADLVEVIGLCTDVCVISNAMLIKSVLPECNVCVRKNCCAGVTAEGHETALKAMAICHIDII